jgi:hypothetical protein
MLTKIAALTVLTLAALPMLAPVAHAATPVDPATRAIFSDDKGKYHAEWADGQNRSGYVTARLAVAGTPGPVIVKDATAPAPAAPKAITGDTGSSVVRPLTNDKGRRL